VKINPTLPYSNNSKLSISQNKNDQLKHNKKRNKRNEIIYIVVYLKERDKVKESFVSSFFRMDPNRPLHHGILSHEHHRVTSKTPPDILQLGRPNIISCCNQDLAVLIQ
jgi:hypothetical protein